MTNIVTNQEEMDQIRRKSMMNLKSILTVQIGQHGICNNIFNIKNILKVDNLQNLHLINLNQQDFSCLQKIKNLQQLELCKCELQNLNFLEKCDKIINLELSSLKIKNINIFNLNTQLKQLSINKCQNLQYFDVLSKCINLESLELCSIYIKNLDFLVTMPKLVKFKLWGCKQIQDIQNIYQCCQLQYLNIQQQRYISIKKIAKLQQLSTLIMINNMNSDEFEMNVEDNQQKVRSQVQKLIQLLKTQHIMKQNKLNQILKKMPISIMKTKSNIKNYRAQMKRKLLDDSETIQKIEQLISQNIKE